MNLQLSEIKRSKNQELRRMMNKWLVICFLVLCTSQVSYAQVPEFDNLEMLYDQGHYKRVYRKSRRLLDQPDYDYSMMPTYYKSISLLRLLQNWHWYNRRKELLVEAEEAYLSVRRSSGGEKIIHAHIYELTTLKQDMSAWIRDWERMGRHDDALLVRKTAERMFGKLPAVEEVEEQQEIVPQNDTEETDNVATNTSNLGIRNTIVANAKEHIGTPYKWAGNSPDGFDCSGFTGYVFGKEGIELPRRSEDQYELSSKIKQKNVKKGDLIFFSNGSGISHVGIIISEKGEPLTMIHSSSSKGIIVTNVEASEYWMKRLHGFGSVVR